MRILARCVGIVALLCIFPASALSRVTVEDSVAIKGQVIMLRAETRGMLFRRGGEIVEFFVDGKSIGKNLSGGDGVAFKQFTPMRTGLHQISVESRGDTDTGLLLSLRRGASVVFVEVQGSLLEGPFSTRPMRGSQRAVKDIHKRFPIVFLQTGLLKPKAMKSWLEKNEFPESPVIPWRRGEVIDYLVKNDVGIKAIIAGPKVIEDAKEYKPLAFSFQEVEDAVQVKDWEEINEKLKTDQDRERGTPLIQVDDPNPRRPFLPGLTLGGPRPFLPGGPCRGDVLPDQLGHRLVVETVGQRQ